jgi:predicted TIM-barrel fold metal-dependent hydrolase
MRRIIDVSVNFRPNTEIGIYDYLGIPREEAQRVEPEKFIVQMDRAEVAMAGLVASVVANGVGGKILATHVDDVAEVVKAHPDRFFGWVGVNPLARAMETLRYIEYGIKEMGFKGVHVYPHWFGYPINDRIYYPIYTKCAELDVPIALQVGTNTPRSGSKCVGRPILLDDVACHFPELKLIGLHIGTPWTHEMTMLARNHQNVFIIADAHPPRQWEKPLIDYITQEEWLNKDGSYKVMWGTDWPMQTFDQSLKEVKDLGLPPEIEARLLGENAIRIFGLDAS